MLRKIECALVLLALGFAPAGAHAVCASAPDDPGPLLLRGTILSCQSAVPEIEERLERGREAHEARVQPLRDRIPNWERMWALRPFDEKVAGRLARVRGVIVTFALEGLMAQSDAEKGAEDGTAPVWKAPVIRQSEYFLHIGGSSCDLLTDPAPTVIVEDDVCCDTDSLDSCLLDLHSASLPPDSLLEALRDGA